MVGWGLAGRVKLSCGERGRACESAGRRKGRIRGSKGQEEGARSRELGGVGLGGKEGGRKAARVGRDAVLILRQSGGGPVHAPCPMRGSRFPDADLPPHFLL